MVHMINYVRARGRVFFSERSERRLWVNPIWGPDLTGMRISKGSGQLQDVTKSHGWRWTWSPALMKLLGKAPVLRVGRVVVSDR
jgi:hypothetical protein